MEQWAKRLLVGFRKDGLLAELQVRLSREKGPQIAYFVQIVGIQLTDIFPPILRLKPEN